MHANTSNLSMLWTRRAKFDSLKLNFFSFLDRVVVLWLDYGLKDRDSSPNKARFICSLYTDRLWGAASLIFNGYLGFSQGVEWLGCDVD